MISQSNHILSLNETKKEKQVAKIDKYLFTESGVFTGKRKTVKIERSRLISCFVGWLFALSLQARNRSLGITGE